MMKRLSVCLVLALACLFAAAPSAKADFVFIGILSGANENPPNDTGSYGVGIFVLSDDATRLDWTIFYTALEGGTLSGAHFHRAPAPGANGPIVRPYPNAMFRTQGGMVTGAWLSTDGQPLTEDLATDMFSGLIYFNIHSTPRWPGGEIRADLGFLLYFAP